MEAEVPCGRDRARPSRNREKSCFVRECRLPRRPFIGVFQQLVVLISVAFVGEGGKLKIY